MAYTLEQFSADGHSALEKDRGPGGREQVRRYVEKACADADFAAFAVSPVADFLPLTGTTFFFGDSTKSDILKKAGVSRARALVFAISDPFGLPRAVATARTLNPRLSTIVRTARVEDTEGLERAGASEIVAAELSAAKEIIQKVMGLYHPAHEREQVQTGEIPEKPDGNR